MDIGEFLSQVSSKVDRGGMKDLEFGFMRSEKDASVL